MYVVHHKDIPVYRFPDPQAFAAWLDEHAEESEAIWLQFAKKGSGQTTITYIEARDVGLCYGWIDSVKNSFDDTYFLNKFSQRRKKSVWSQVNVGVIEKLIAEGKMKPRGMREVEAAKADGRWDQAYAPQSTATVPEDLQAAIDASPRAKEFFSTLKGASRYAFIFRLISVTDPEKRATKIQQYVQQLENGEAPHLFQSKK
ncbi:YdeI/OmpD-associated family protein [soil metagenome]